MTSKRFVTGAVIVGVLSSVPAFAQERRARPRSEQGGNRGDQGGDRSGGERRTRSADAPRPVQRNEVAQERSGRSYAPPRAPEQRSYQGRSTEAPRQYQSPAPRQYDNRSYQAPRRYESPTANRYDNRGYNNRYDNRSYSRPPVYNNRGYVAPRRDPYYRNYGYGYRPGVRAPYYGYRGVYGYGHGYRTTRIVRVVPWRPYYYRPRFSIGVYYGAGGVYAYGHTPSYYYDPIPGRAYGGVRITDAPHEAQVFADGYYVGIVDDFDGVFQHVNLEAGQHRIEVRAPGLQPISFDVYVQPGRTITLRADAYDDGYTLGYGDGDADGY